MKRDTVLTRATLWAVRAVRVVWALVLLWVPAFALTDVAWAAPPSDLPQGYFVWIKGDLGQPTTRRIFRMTLPDKTDVIPLTAGEDVECQISPDGKWVAYAKAKLPASDYHQFNSFWLYVVSIHGVGDGREEIRVDDNGYWPSWGTGSVLYYSQVDPDRPQHTRIIKTTIDEYGNVGDKMVVVSTQATFGSIGEVNECFMAPDQSWFVGRTRGSSSVNGVGAFSVSPAAFSVLARAGSIGCMPYIAPSGTWGFIAGREQGIRWGDGPQVADGRVDQQLIEPLLTDGFCYHPGISNDEKWFMAAHSTDDDHNAGPYDIYIYELDGKVATYPRPLAVDGFNGWPDLWVGEPSEPPPPTPHVNAFYPSSYTVLVGEEVELFWGTVFADEVTLDDAVVPANGSALRTVSQSTDFTLRAARGGVDDAMDVATVHIVANETLQPVEIVEFIAEPDTVVVGNSVELSWQVSNATTVDMDGSAVAPIGSLVWNPVETISLVLTARGHQGPVSETVTVTVTPIGELHEPLPDRGGCQCDDGSGGHGLATLLALLAIMALRRRHSRVA